MAAVSLVVNTGTITLAFYRGRFSGRWTSRLLAWWMRCDWSHVCIVWEVDGDRALISEATLRGGVHTGWRHWDGWMYDCWVVPADVAAVRAWWAVNEGQRYDWLGLAGFIFRRIKGLSTAAWCSEATTASQGIPDAWRYDVALASSVARWIGWPLPRAQAQHD